MVELKAIKRIMNNYRILLERYEEKLESFTVSDYKKQGFIKENMDETVFMFALFKCRKFDKRRN